MQDKLPKRLQPKAMRIPQSTMNADWNTSLLEFAQDACRRSGLNACVSRYGRLACGAVDE
ncbi:MAG: hypothetical protein OXR73_18690 [Myxococcales bacterium]|nr:hypothetical protein [Myxococcales bacterium]